MHQRWIWIAYALLAFAFWGARPLWEPDEGRYGESARGMAVAGDWLTPRLQGVPHLTKPPMTYWLAAAGLRATGVGPDQPVGNAWGARAPLAIAFFLTLLCVRAIGLAWKWPAPDASLGALVFGTALLPFVCGHVLTTDMLLTFFETLGVLAALRAWRGEARWRLIFWLAFGFAFLVKGPPGLLPMLALIAFAWLRRGVPRSPLFSWPGLAIFLCIAASWFVAIEIASPGRWQYFVKDEFVNRIATDEHDRGKPLWFYPVALVLGMAPWLHLWPPLAASLWRGARRGAFRARFRALPDDALFAILWFFLPLTVFFISSSKMYFYIVPILVPVALWMARLHLRRWPRGVPKKGAQRIAFLAIAALWSAGLLLFTIVPDRISAANSYAALAEAVRQTPSTTRSAVFVHGGAPHSISFYSARTLIERDDEKMSTGPFFKMLVARAQTGDPTYLLVRDGDEDELEKRETAWREIARQREWVFVQILGPAASASNP